MKQPLALTIFFAIAWLNSGCAGFGYTELQDALPVEKGKTKTFYSLEYSPGISNELFSKKYISDTVKYYLPYIFEHKPQFCLMFRAGEIFGITNNDAISVQAQSALFPNSIGIKLGYKRLMMNSSSNYLAGYFNVGYTKLLNYRFYDASLTNDEDGSEVRFYSDIIQFKTGIVFTHLASENEGKHSKVYLGTSIQFNQANTEVRGGISVFRLPFNYDYKILDKQKRNWLTLIPYGGFSLGSESNTVIELAFPIWYDSLLKKWKVTPAIGVELSDFF